MGELRDHLDAVFSNMIIELLYAKKFVEISLVQLLENIIEQNSLRTCMLHFIVL